MLNKKLFALIILLLSIISISYYQYKLSSIPKLILKSDNTMLQVDAMRFTFKIGLLLEKSQLALRIALDKQDEDMLDESLEYIEAASGFLYTSFIKNEKLIEPIRQAGYIRSNAEHTWNQRFIKFFDYILNEI